MVKVKVKVMVRVKAKIRVMVRDKVRVKVRIMVKVKVRVRVMVKVMVRVKVMVKVMVKVKVRVKVNLKGKRQCTAMKSEKYTISREPCGPGSASWQACPLPIFFSNREPVRYSRRVSDSVNFSKKDPPRKVS